MNARLLRELLHQNRIYTILLEQRNTPGLNTLNNQSALSPSTTVSSDPRARAHTLPSRSRTTCPARIGLGFSDEVSPHSFSPSPAIPFFAHPKRNTPPSTLGAYLPPPSFSSPCLIYLPTYSPAPSFPLQVLPPSPVFPARIRTSPGASSHRACSRCARSTKWSGNVLVPQVATQH
ncbi:hypothetical protein OF83DRAFT_1156676 [Amylostereum chailletii]|nr:hypothetical protein OF83DRAFT_1156676 [Amylostereum chailletii]